MSIRPLSLPIFRYPPNRLHVIALFVSVFGVSLTLGAAAQTETTPPTPHPVKSSQPVNLDRENPTPLPTPQPKPQVVRSNDSDNATPAEVGDAGHQVVATVSAAVARLASAVQNVGAAPASAKAAASPQENIWQIAGKHKLALPLAGGHIVILKSKRCLQLWDDKVLLKTYTVALGANPQGSKQFRGDKRTPEGNFFICTRNAQNSAFHIFLGLSYPALPDAKRGVASKAISWREYQLISRQIASRSAPLWSTRLGGWVGIHGGTNSSFAQKRRRERNGDDWTAGCIALTNAEIEELYAATRLGTSVTIKP